MLWRLFNKLFGWQYAIVFACYNDYGRIKRIISTKDGPVFKRGAYGYSKLRSYQHCTLTE